MHARPVWKCWGRVVDVLVETILSQNTSNANSHAGYRQLRRAFRTWNAVADAPTQDVARAIRVSGLSNIKAPRIQKILQEIRQDNVHAGRKRLGISLEYMRDLPPREAYRRLMEFDGVGPKTAACVLLFSFGMPIFPVDTHIVRIAIRLGLVPPGTSAQKCQDLMEPSIRPKDRYAMHILLVTHGRKICRAKSPKCEWCDLLDMCPEGKKRAAK